ncbi:MAG: sigma-70 family RNA polymerase sigma factor [Acidimicrobiales bacterium]
MREVEHVVEAAPGRPDFAGFYREAYPDAVRLAVLLVGVADAEDVVQDAFAAVFGRFEQLDRPVAYLRTTLVNGSRQLHRAGGRRQRRQRLVAEPDLLHPEHRELLDVLGRLSVEQRSVVVLRVWAGWPDDEIAATLGCRPSTVRSHAMRAMARLRQELQE